MTRTLTTCALLGALLHGAAIAAQADAMPAIDELIAIALPKWSDDEAGRMHSIPVTKTMQAWSSKAPRPGERRKVVVQPDRVLQLTPKRYALVAKLLPVTDDGTPQAGHGTPVGLAAYIFDTSATGWKLVQRQEPFDLRGFEGQVQLETVQLSDQRQGLAAEYGSCWQGHCGTWMALYEVGSERIQVKPVLELQLKTGNVYTRYDCARRLAPILPHLNPPDRSVDVGERDCYLVDSKWRIAQSPVQPGDITVTFSGAHSSKEGTPVRRIEQSLQYRYRGARYEVVSGSNPVPKLWKEE